MKKEKFDHREEYTNYVRIYRKIGGICEIGSDISCYIQFAPELENGSVLKIYCLNLDDKIGYFSENCSCSIPVNLARRFNVDLLGVEL